MVEPGPPQQIKVTCAVCDGRLVLAATWEHETPPAEPHNIEVKVGG